LKRLQDAKLNFLIGDRISVEFNEKIVDWIGLSEDLAYITGFGGDQETKIKNKSKAKAMPDLYAGIHGFCVYEIGGLVANTIFNDQMAPILQYVTIGGEPGKPHTIYYPKPRYVPIATNYITDLHFQIKTLQNEPMPFDWGNTVITLLITKSVGD
jgi:hypothetical protein